MGYGLTIYQVPAADLKRACGGGDLRLLGAAFDALGDDLTDYDDQMDAPSPENDVDISHADALREIVAGKFTPGVPGSRYGWALECLCGFLGQSLDNTGFVPCDTQWYFTLDELITEHQVPLKFADLIYRSPVSIPEADDWPCIGHWGPRDYAAAGELAAVLPRVSNSEIHSALLTALGWLQSGIEHPDCLIIGFHG